MQKPDKPQDAPHPKRPEKDCCNDSKCEGGLRNNYFDGKRFTVDSCRVEQRYALDKRRLINRAIHGWGVVYGYEIKLAGGQLSIGPGLALDECGRELYQVCERTVDFDHVILLDEDGRIVDRDKAFPKDDGSRRARRDERRACWRLCVHYAERNDGKVAVDDPCRCEHDEWEHTCETVRYTLQRVPCDDRCKEHECSLKCECGGGKCCDEKPSPTHGRGGCRCVCDHLTHLNPNPDCCCNLRTIKEPCTEVRVDLGHGVPLVCVGLAPDDCHPREFGGDIDPCGPRRLVKRNDLLFDLIRGCDLTHISKIGWYEWHRSDDLVPFTEFWKALGPDLPPNQDEYVTDKFWVRFSRPVRVSTLKPDCFAMTIMTIDPEGRWWTVQRVPIVGVVTTGEAGDPRHAREARIVVEGGWVEDAVRGRGRVFEHSDAWVELDVRGDFIVDCNGQTVDANAFGLSPGPTGNGTPGGTFRSSFRVQQAVSTSRVRTKGAE